MSERDARGPEELRRPLARLSSLRLGLARMGLQEAVGLLTRRPAAAPEALLQGLHEVDHLVLFLGLFGADQLLALLLASDEIAQRVLVAVLELRRVELGLLLLDDLLGDLQHAW